MASETTHQATSFFAAVAKWAISPSAYIDRPREIASAHEKRGRGPGRGVVPLHCAYAYGSPRIMCRDELGAFSFSSSASSVTASTALPAGEVVAGQRILRAPPVHARKIHTARKSTLAHP